MFSFGWFDLQKRYGAVFSALLATVVIFYIVAHTLTGERGLYMLFKQQRRLELVRAELSDVSAKRQRLEHDVSLLRSDSLDLDLVDEQARRYLGYAGKDEIVITGTAQKK